jgi:hypothetical protein
MSMHIELWMKKHLKILSNSDSPPTITKKNPEKMRKSRTAMIKKHDL